MNAGWWYIAGACYTLMGLGTLNLAYLYTKKVMKR